MQNQVVDVVVVGAGLSGIGAASWLGMKLPRKSYVVLEARDDVGGTWDLFRYPGVRSDSDMHTLGFSFHPWKDRDAIAAAGKIKRYIGDTIDRFGVRPHLRLGHKVVSARWSTDRARWRIVAERKDGVTVSFDARFLFMGSGYYNYASGYAPRFDGQEQFTGKIVHPQSWPEDLDYRGKRIVVIGSGATAVTLIPALAKDVGHITMLQRSPAYILAAPRQDKIANFFKSWFPASAAHVAARWKNVLIARALRWYLTRNPQKMRPFMLRLMHKSLPDHCDKADFTPRHEPSQQRVCLAPNGDFFDVLRNRQASVVTGEVDRLVSDGILLKSGEKLAADIIVTATGLKLQRGGNVDISVDGEPLNFVRTVIYKGAMYSNVPNFMLVFGYTGASWTLKADLVARYLIRVLEQMDAAGADIAVPVADVDAMQTTWMIPHFTSGYIVRAREHMPRQGFVAPWQVHQEYLADRKIMLRQRVDDGVLKLLKAGQPWRLSGTLVAAASPPILHPRTSLAPTKRT